VRLSKHYHLVSEWSWWICPTHLLRSLVDGQLDLTRRNNKSDALTIPLHYQAILVYVPNHRHSKLHTQRWKCHESWLYVTNHTPFLHLKPGLAGCPLILSLQSSLSWAPLQDRPEPFISTQYFGLYPNHLSWLPSQRGFEAEVPVVQPITWKYCHRIWQIGPWNLVHCGPCGHFSVTCLRDLFETVNNRIVIDFIKEIRFYSLL